MLENVSNRPMDADIDSLENQASVARGERAKSKTPRKTENAHESSVAYANLLAGVMGLASTARDEMYSTLENSVRLTDGQIVSLRELCDEYDLSFAKATKNPRADFVTGAIAGRKTIVTINVPLATLRETFPVAETKTRKAGVKFEFSVVTETTHVYSYPDNDGLMNHVESIVWSGNQKRGNVTINGIAFAIQLSNAITEFPERFNADGSYIPVRKVETENGSSTSPEREVYVLRFTLENGENVTIRDYGITNLHAKVMRYQESRIIQ